MLTVKSEEIGCNWMMLCIEYVDVHTHNRFIREKIEKFID